MPPLHLKYRPEDLDDVMGNEGAVASLKTLLERDRSEIPHTMLFVGPSGCGKTTLARIIAYELGCDDGDLIEVDTGDFRGIDTARDIRKDMMLAPLMGECKVWILDEFHRATNDCQSAMLKAFEDTPENVYFLLATTDPQKLLPTIRNRCTTFTVEAQTERNLIRLMKRILSTEKKEVPDEVLNQIAQDSLGSPRASLVILDQIIDLPKAAMSDAAKQWAAQENEVIELCRILVSAKPKWSEVAKIISGISTEPESVRRAVLGYCSAALLRSGDEKFYSVMDCFTKNYYDTGKAGLVMSCYLALFGE